MLARSVLLLSLLLITFSALSDTPDWYKHQNITAKTHYSYIGYGSAKSIQLAKQAAREDIATQLFVIVETVTESESGIENEKFMLSARHRSKQQTYAKLNKTKVLKSEFVDKTFYVALEYKHLTIVQHFINQLNVTTCEDEVQHPYLIHTPLFTNLNDKLPCKLNIELVRKNQTWMLAYKEILIQLDDQNFSSIYTTVQKDSLQITPSSFRPREGEIFTVAINSSSAGYVTLFNVYADGIVSLLQENIFVEANKVRIFPTEKDEVIFESVVLEKEKETTDLYIGLYSESPIAFPRFKEAGSTVQSNQWQYQFDYLLQLMKRQRFSVILLRIIPA